MASTFKNSGLTVSSLDHTVNDIYTCPSGAQAVIHALFVTNHSETTVANVDVKCTIDGGTTFKHIAKNISVPQENTLTIDKPINMAAGDKLRVLVRENPDSSVPQIEAFASILEVT